MHRRDLQIRLRERPLEPDDPPDRRHLVRGASPLGEPGSGPAEATHREWHHRRGGACKSTARRGKMPATGLHACRRSTRSQPGRKPGKGRFVSAGQPVGLPGVALSHDLGDRLHPGDQGARSARVPGRGAVPVRDVEPEHGRGDRGRLLVVLPVADVPDDLRRRARGARAGDEVRGGRPRDRDRGWRDHAVGPGKLVDATSVAISFIVPAGCFAIVGLYALYDLRARPSVIGGEPARGPAPVLPAAPARPVGGAI